MYIYNSTLNIYGTYKPVSVTEINSSYEFSLVEKEGTGSLKIAIC